MKTNNKPYPTKFQNMENEKNYWKELYQFREEQHQKQFMEMKDYVIQEVKKHNEEANRKANFFINTLKDHIIKLQEQNDKLTKVNIELVEKIKTHKCWKKQYEGLKEKLKLEI
jgi:hypothetical protein